MFKTLVVPSQMLHPFFKVHIFILKYRCHRFAYFSDNAI